MAPHTRQTASWAEDEALLESRECHSPLRLTVWLLESLPARWVWLPCVVPTVRYVGPAGVT